MADGTGMKLSQLPLFGAALLLAGMAWMVLDMSRPMPTTPGASSRGVVAAIASSSAARPVMVEFYADWCGPCRVVGPVVEEFAREMAGRAEVLRVNVDECPELAREHGVRGIPAFVVFKNGRETARQVGGIPKSEMRRLLNP